MSKGSTRRICNVSQDDEQEGWDRWMHRGKYAKRLGKQERRLSRSAKETEDK